jgi:acrylyl-CoA reductase (NADPH)
MEKFKALRVYSEDGQVQARLEQLAVDELSAGTVLIRASYSSINFKDALAVTGKGKIMRRFPLIAGVDVAGTVAASEDSRFSAGDEVLVTGCGLGEEHDGGFSELVRIPAEWVIKLPKGLSQREAMQLGTAGFTAGLALERLERNGTHPASGPVLVTGATGGVGSLAVDMLNKAGYSVTALTGKAEQREYLTSIGADEVLIADELDLGKRPLERAQWGAAVDNVGGEVLTWITRTTRPWCNIAAIGLAASHALNTTVMPFILRGVSLIGINSVDTPRDLRERVWQRLSQELKPRHLEKISRHETTLEKLPDACQQLLERRVSGRFVVKIREA